MNGERTISNTEAATMSAQRLNGMYQLSRGSTEQLGSGLRAVVSSLQSLRICSCTSSLTSTSVSRELVKTTVSFGPFGFIVVIPFQGVLDAQQVSISDLVRHTFKSVKFLFFG